MFVPAINDFFTSWFLALPFASQQAELIIQDLVNELDQPKKTNAALNDILTALVAGLAFTGLEGAAAGVAGALTVSELAGQALLIGLQQAPGVAKALWPAGTAESQSIQIGNLDSELGTLSNQLSDIINNGLGMIMSDMPSFVGFASTGKFSGSTSYSIPDDAQGLDLALKTYVTSSAFAANGWIAAIDPITDRSGATCPNAGGTDFCDPHEPLWYSNSLDQSFFIGYDTAKKTPAGAGSDATVRNYPWLNVFQKGWTTPVALFEGAYKCAQAGNFDSGSLVNIGGTGGVDLSCMSRMIECGSGSHSLPFVQDCPKALNA